MKRNVLLAMSATLNVTQAWLARSGRRYLTAANLINLAVVEIHRAERWDSSELGRMGKIQNELVSILPERTVPLGGHSHPRD